MQIQDDRKNDTLKVLDYVYSIQANSTETFGFNTYYENPCQSKYLAKIPTTLCESTADTLTKMSLLRGFLWIVRLEQNIVQVLPRYNQATIASLMDGIIY